MECFKITAKGSIMTPNHTMLSPGQVLTREQCDSMRLPIEQHLHSGYMVRMGEQRDPQELREMLPTGVNQHPVMKAETDTRKEAAIISVDKDAVPTQVEPAAVPAAAPVADPDVPDAAPTETANDAANGALIESLVVDAPSVWTVDPTTLVESSLADMNTRIKELDVDGPQFTTVEEAGAWLSQDFKPVQETETGAEPIEPELVTQPTQVATG